MSLRHRAQRAKARLSGLSVPESVERHRRKLVATYLEAVEESSIEETKAAVRRIRDDPRMAVGDATSETEARLRATKVALEDRGITTHRMVWTAILLVLSAPVARRANRIGTVLAELSFQFSQGYVVVGDEVVLDRSRWGEAPTGVERFLP